MIRKKAGRPIQLEIAAAPDDRTLQERVHRLFFDSLMTFGVLGLGHKESIRFSPHEAGYEELDPSEKLYRKIG